MDERIWYQDPLSFVGPGNFQKFVPLPGMTYEEQLNSIARFAVYLSLLIALVRRSPRALYIAAFALGFTWFMHRARERETYAHRTALEGAGLAWDPRRRRACVAPSEDNPFMNVLAHEYRERPKRPPACDITDCDVRRSVHANFERDLVRDAADIFGNMASDRQYYAMPVTTIPNDQEAFMNWALRPPPTCKERSIQCWRGRPKGV